MAGVRSACGQPRACVVAFSACVRVVPGSRPKSSQRSQYSSTVGGAHSPFLKAVTRGCETPISRATDRIDGRILSESHCSQMIRMSSLSSSVHSFAFTGMEVIVSMSSLLNKEMSRQLDKAVNLLTIEDMEGRFTTCGVGEIAIAMLDRFCSGKGVTREALARRLGVSRQTVTSRFRVRSMTLQDFLDTCAALDVDASAVLSRAARLHDVPDGDGR